MAVIDTRHLPSSIKTNPKYCKRKSEIRQQVMRSTLMAML